MTFRTEDEARKAICPHLPASRVTVVQPSGMGEATPVSHVMHYPNCVASSCMAWRWKAAPLGGGSGTRGPVLREVEATAMPDHVEGHAWLFDRDSRKWGLFAKAGYCGAFGVPA